nr:MAG TPA: hypothetical protein [Caudoviricetes sp.]
MIVIYYTFRSTPHGCSFSNIPEPQGSFFMPIFRGGDAECPTISVLK